MRRFDPRRRLAGGNARVRRSRTETIGDVTTAWSPNMTGALRASGAMGLLSPFKVRRAGAI